MAIENENLTIGDFKHEHVIQLGLRHYGQWYIWYISKSKSRL